jgi:hypothetical protein
MAKLATRKAAQVKLWTIDLAAAFPSLAHTGWQIGDKHLARRLTDMSPKKGMGWSFFDIEDSCEDRINLEPEFSRVPPEGKPRHGHPSIASLLAFGSTRLEHRQAEGPTIRAETTEELQTWRGELVRLRDRAFGGIQRATDPST